VSKSSRKNQIDSLRKEIAKLQSQLATFVREEKAINVNQRKSWRRKRLNEKLSIYRKRLLLASDGLSTTAIAKKLGCKPWNMSSNIDCAWEHFYPNHYENSDYLRSVYGTLTALRESERPFDCELRDSPYIPDYMQEEFLRQKELARFIPFSEKQPSVDDDYIHCSNDGIKIEAVGGYKLANSGKFLFWRSLRSIKGLPQYWSLLEYKKMNHQVTCPTPKPRQPIA